MRVALIHDWLTGMRGGERCLEAFARLHPGAELFTLIHVAGSTSPEIERLPIHASRLSGLPGAARHYRKLLPLFPRAIEAFDLSDYELVISTHHAVAKGVRTRPDQPHLCYCLTPMRYVWSHADAYLGRGLRRAASAPLAARLRRFDVETARPERVTRFVAISRAVAARVRLRYGREARVVHPPVEVERFAPIAEPARDYYLMVGSFVPYKREALAIDAFRDTNRRLVVAGDGPLRERLRADAPRNVEFVGRVPDAELAGLYANCRALVYPQEEDFGIVAVEAQAAGRPVIAFGKGGATDSVVPLPGPAASAHSAPPHGAHPTGIWFEEQTPLALRRALELFEQHENRFDPKQIRAWAEGFAGERFRREIQREIHAAQERAEVFASA